MKDRQTLESFDRLMPHGCNSHIDDALYLCFPRAITLCGNVTVCLYVSTSKGQARSNRSLCHKARKVRIACPPGTRQRIPERLRR
jgi:hypothetical protein